MASAGRTLGRQYDRNVGRDGFRFLGRTRTATKSLKGRLAVAQPPGATMAVTGKQVNTRHARSKGATSERLTTSKKAGSLLRQRSRNVGLSGRTIPPPTHELKEKIPAFARAKARAPGGIFYSGKSVMQKRRRGVSCPG